MVLVNPKRSFMFNEVASIEIGFNHIHTKIPSWLWLTFLVLHKSSNHMHLPYVNHHNMIKNMIKFSFNHHPSLGIFFSHQPSAMPSGDEIFLLLVLCHVSGRRAWPTMYVTCYDNTYMIMPICDYICINKYYIFIWESIYIYISFNFTCMYIYIYDCKYMII